MTKIEMAISEIIGTNYGECQCHRETMVQAVEALREQAEREKGCEYCEPACKNCKHDIYDDFCQHYGSNGCNKAYYEPKHNYCPMCGKRLEDKP